MSSLLISSNESLFLVDRFGNFVSIRGSDKLLELTNQFQPGLRILYLGENEEMLSFLEDLITRRPELLKLILPIQEKVITFKRDLWLTLQ